MPAGRARWTRTSGSPIPPSIRNPTLTRGVSHQPAKEGVARTLETRWEARLSALAEAEAALAAVRDSGPALPDRDGLRALAADLPALWHAPETRDRDRKRLLRTLISDVTLLPETDRARARLGVRWHTGVGDELDLRRPATSPEVRRTPAAARELIARLGPDHSDAEIVTALADAGLTTGTGRPYDLAAVAWVRHTYNIPGRCPFRDGEISVDQAAAILGITADAVYYWLTHDRLAGRKDTSGRWCVPWNAHVEAACRRQIDASGHLIPRTPGPREVLPGDVTVQEAAARLDVPADVVYYRIRIGQLTARRTPNGCLSLPWNPAIEAACRTRIEHPGSGPTGLGSRPLPHAATARGEISVQEAAARLGIPTPQIYYWIRRGYLTAHRVNGDRVAIPWNNQVETDCLHRATRTMKINSTTQTTTAGGAV
ncbi:helix-turn-helix domain-containing protein [Pseudofrankia sp. BMG5.36]|uniref:helix-turn-helix domain-containing protein n=1 Tax=Pseudofrankia sp. BMG5.36 TaxID=1834512 RepID=UPI000A9E07B7|nr:helix-turn-helix domain-containing protein [Pseudofrankia sp. BMG5.36]